MRLPTAPARPAPRLLRAVLLLPAALLALATPAAAVAPAPPPLAGAPFFAARPGTPARFTFRAPDATGFFDTRGLALVVAGPKTSGDWALRWGWTSAREIEPRPASVQRATVNELIGPQAQWRRDLPTWGALQYDEVSPGVRVVFEPRPSGVEYRLEVAPGASISDLRFYWEGATGLVREGPTALGIRTGLGTLSESGLACFHPLPDGSRRAVACAFTQPVSSGTRWTYGIDVDGADPALPLVVDPTVNWRKYLGGDQNDHVAAMATQEPRFTVVGQTFSATFPSPTGTPTRNGVSDAFIAGYDNNDLKWTTFLGGDAHDAATSVARDDGCSFIGGASWAADDGTPPTFPLKSKPGVEVTDKTIEKKEGWLVRLCGEGNDLQWATYVGGSGNDEITGVAVWEGNVFVVGTTDSTDLLGMTQTSNKGGLDAFAMSLEAGFGRIIRNVYLGGAGVEHARAIAYDADVQGFFVAGDTDSENFPAHPAFGEAKVGRNGFVCLINDVQLTTKWCGVFAGDGEDSVAALALLPPQDAQAPADSSRLYVVGNTKSPTGLSTPGASQTASGGGEDVFAGLLKVSAVTAEVRWVTYLGGMGDDTAFAATADEKENLVVAGRTLSPNFPLHGGPPNTSRGKADGFITRIASDGAGWLWSTIVGGTADDEVRGLTHVASNLYAAVQTDSTDLAKPPAPAPGMANALVVRFERSQVVPWTQVNSVTQVRAKKPGHAALSVQWASVVNSGMSLAKLDLLAGTDHGKDDLGALRRLSLEQVSAHIDIIPAQGPVYATVRLTTSDGYAYLDSQSLVLEVPDGGFGELPADAGVDGRVDGGGAGELEPGAEPRSVLGWSCATADGGGAQAAVALAFAVAAIAALRRRPQ